MTSPLPRAGSSPSLGRAKGLPRAPLPMKTIQILTLLLLATGAVAADAPTEPSNVAQITKPTVKLAADGYPTGGETPEGAACDLARAFINRDATLFKATCLPPYLGGESRKAYEQFLADTTTSMEAEAKKADASPAGPKSIGKVFTARHLTLSGPGSYAYAMLNCQDVMFVDVGCFLHDGGQFLNRTLVVKTGKGEWRVHPMPQNDPLLSTGLNEEKDSTADFTEGYEIPKP